MSKPLLITKFLSHSKRSLTKSKTRAIYTTLVEKIEISPIATPLYFIKIYNLNNNSKLSEIKKAI